MTSKLEEFEQWSWLDAKAKSLETETDYDYWNVTELCADDFDPPLTSVQRLQLTLLQWHCDEYNSLEETKAYVPRLIHTLGKAGYGIVNIADLVDLTAHGLALQKAAAAALDALGEDNAKLHQATIHLLRTAIALSYSTIRSSQKEREEQ